MTKDQFMKILRKLQQYQQMAVGETIDFKVVTYRYRDDAASIDFMINKGESYLRSGTIHECDEYKQTCERVKGLADYLKTNKWI